MHSNPLSGFKRQIALDEISSLNYFRSVEWFDSIDSTNKWLARSVRERSIALPALLVSDKQSAGVGRGSNAWWSPTGCLMFSMAIPVYPESPSSIESVDQRTHSALLPLRIGCTIAECLESISSRPPMVKWPNDIYLAGRKIAGVLIEVLSERSTSSASAIAIIGIGINCQVDLAHAPADLRNIATSLHEWSPSSNTELSSPEHVLVQFVHQWLFVEKRQIENPSWLLENWAKRSLLDGQWVEVKHANGIAQGQCIGINESGALRIQNEQLEVIEILAGTVNAFRPMSP